MKEWLSKLPDSENFGKINVKLMKTLGSINNNGVFAEYYVYVPIPRS